MRGWIEATPRHRVANRMKDCYGVGELVELQYQCLPVLREPVKFRIKQGSGTITQINCKAGWALFMAGNRCEDVVISVRSIPQGIELAQVELHVVAPQGLRFVPQSDSMDVSRRGARGFRGELTLLPNGVSFENVLVREGAMHASASGCYHNWNYTEDLASVIPATIEDANRVCGFDRIHAGPLVVPWRAGAFEASILWEYCVLGCTEWSVFAHTDYSLEMLRRGALMVRKFDVEMRVNDFAPLDGYGFE